MDMTKDDLEDLQYAKNLLENPSLAAKISSLLGAAIEKRFAKSFLKQTEYIHSTFDVGRSMFDVHQFLFRLDRPLFLPAAGLTP
jgi:hypothetical protein